MMTPYILSLRWLLLPFLYIWAFIVSLDDSTEEIE